MPVFSQERLTLPNIINLGLLFPMVFLFLAVINSFFIQRLKERALASLAGGAKSSL